MALRYTPFVSTDDVNPLELNERLTELSNSVDGVVDGSEAQTPSISDFTNATHDHEDAAGGGQLTVAALSSGAATDGQVATADGAGNVAWETLAVPDEFTDLTDTPANYSGLGGGVLRVNSGETAVEAVISNIHHYELNEGSDYTTTSTSFVDVDGTNLSFSVTVQSGSRGILVTFHGTVYDATASQVVYLDVAVDGTPDGGNDGYVGNAFETGASVRPNSFLRYIPLSPGTYTISLQWKVSGGTGVLYAGPTGGVKFHSQMLVMEVI